MAVELCNRNPTLAGATNPEDGGRQQVSPTSSKPSRKWTFSSGCSQHLTGDPSAFISFTSMPNCLVHGIGGSVIDTGTGSIRLRCKTQKGARSISIHNVWYIPNCRYNLLSFGMLQQAGVPIRITKFGFSIGSQRVRAVKNSGVYFLQLEVPTALFSETSWDVSSSTINEETYRFWHERLDYLKPPRSASIDPARVFRT